MTPNEYQQLALKTEDTPRFAGGETQSRLLHGAIGMATEAGELLGALKKQLIYGKPVLLVNVMEECGDTLWYIALTLDAAGYTLEQAMAANIAKLQARYGDEFSTEKALNRDLNAEDRALREALDTMCTCEHTLANMCPVHRIPSE